MPLTEKEVNILRDIYNQIDANGDGRITHDEFMAFFERVGYIPKKSDMTVLLGHFDADLSRDIDFDEFCSGIFELPDRERDLLLLVAEFQFLDKDSSGFLDRIELRKLFENSNVKDRIEAEVDKLLDSMDTNGDGVISFGEFKKAIHPIGRPFWQA